LAWGCVLEDWFRRDDLQELRRGVGQLSSLQKAIVLTGMGHTLTHDNAALIQASTEAVSPRLDSSAAASAHRGITDIIYRVRNSDVFLTAMMSQANVRFLRSQGFKVYMFSVYAPSHIETGEGYDPYREGIEVLPIFAPDAFYRTQAHAGN